MSKVWLYQELRDKVLNDLDMQGELIVTPTELLGYCNAAIEEAQAEIHTIYEDYYLTHLDITLTQGQSVYPLPADLLAEKIRGFVYINGTTIYNIRRIQGAKKFAKIAWGQTQQDQSDDYRYFLENPSQVAGYQINLVPVSRETGPVARLWYIRTADRIVNDTDTLDIPQFAQFVIEFMKGMCKAKENGGQLPPDAAMMIEQKRKMMVDTLTKMVPDDDDTIEGDFSAYTEMT